MSKKDVTRTTGVTDWGRSGMLGDHAYSRRMADKQGNEISCKNQWSLTPLIRIGLTIDLPIIMLAIFGLVGCSAQNFEDPLSQTVPKIYNIQEKPVMEQQAQTPSKEYELTTNNPIIKKCYEKSKFWLPKIKQFIELPIESANFIQIEELFGIKMVNPNKDKPDVMSDQRYVVHEYKKENEYWLQYLVRDSFRSDERKVDSIFGIDEPLNQTYCVPITPIQNYLEENGWIPDIVEDNYMDPEANSFLYYKKNNYTIRVSYVYWTDQKFFRNICVSNYNNYE